MHHNGDMALPPHVPIAVKIFPHLVECAKTGRRTNYDELGEAAGVDTRLFSRPLAFIRDWVCIDHNIPPISVLVERKGGTTVSNRFNPVLCATMTAAEYAAAEKEVIQQVYDYQGWDRALSGLQNLFPESSS